MMSFCWLLHLAPYSFLITDLKLCSMSAIDILKKPLNVRTGIGANVDNSEKWHFEDLDFIVSAATRKCHFYFCTISIKRENEKST